MERRAAEQAAKLAGASEVWLEDAGWAAALGCGLPLDEPQGSMVVDIGAGTTTASVYSMQGRVACQSRVMGADSWDQAIISYIRKEHHVVVNEETARGVQPHTVPRWLWKSTRRVWYNYLNEYETLPGGIGKWLFARF